MVMTVKGKKQIWILNAKEKNLSSIKQNHLITISIEEKPSRKQAREVETKRWSESGVNKAQKFKSYLSFVRQFPSMMF